MSEISERIQVLGQYLDAGLTPLGQIHLHGQASLALLYSSLFVPDVEEVEGSVLLSWNLSDKQRERFIGAKRSSQDYQFQELEASYNSVEVSYIFGTAEGRDLQEEDDVVLAEIIAKAWRGFFKITYPDRYFEVEVLDPDVTQGVVGLRFFEIRNTSKKDTSLG